MGEAQHRWTNKLTGIGLSPVDGIESYEFLKKTRFPHLTAIVSARLVDEQAAEEIAAEESTHGTLSSSSPWLTTSQCYCTQDARGGRDSGNHIYSQFPH